ncbi:MAG: alpha/beta hydrolase [Acidobacteria bacterium]|nr:MAG: alpha/beta hydrolase [Acidobacteriota bacterium]
MRTLNLPVIALIVVVLLAGCGQSQGESPSEKPADPAVTPGTGTVFSAIPEILDPSADYLIYLHGAIIEDQGMQPTHPQWGTYHYAEILQAFADRGFTVISEARPAGTRPDVYADHVIGQIRHLLDGGVPENRVTIVGFSKGGVIALLASRIIARENVTWIIQGGCGPWLERFPEFVPGGRVLSQIDQADDVAQSCADLFTRMPEGAVFDENTLELGSGHGAFYKVSPEWFEPAVEWAGK